MDLCELFDYIDWHAARQVGKLERTSQHKGRTHRQVRYFVTGLPAPDPHWEIEGAGPAQLLQLIRGHWAIENPLHYVRDVSFGQDGRQIRSGAAPLLLAAPRYAVIGLLSDAGWSNIAAAIRYNAWRPGATLHLPGLAPI
jgi:hypothetical protein